MTNHLQEQAGAGMPQDNILSSNDSKNHENQPVEMVEADESNSSPVEDHASVTVAENDHTYIENEVQETDIDENRSEEESVELVQKEVAEEEPIVAEVVTAEEESIVEEEAAVNEKIDECSGEEEYPEETEFPEEEIYPEEEEYSSDEELVEEPIPTGKSAPDYAGFTRKEIIERFRTLLDKGDIDTIREELDNMKFQFYRKLKAEEELKRAVYIENGGVEESYEYEEDEQELILKSLMIKYRDIRIVQNEKLETEKQKNLEEKLKIIDEIKELTNSSESIGETFQQFRELQNRWRSIGLVPQSKVKNLWDTYHHYVEVFYDYIKINKDLRDLDFKRNL